MLTATPDDQEDLDVLDKRLGWMQQVGNFLTQSSQPALVQANYREFQETLWKLRSDLQEFRDSDPEFLDFATSVHRFSEEYFYGLVDMLKYNFESRRLRSARNYYSRMIETWPAMFPVFGEDKVTELQVGFRSSRVALEAMKPFQSAAASELIGDYQDATENYTRAAQAYSEIPGTDLLVFLCQAKASLTEALHLEYDREEFTDAADSYNQAAESFQRVAGLAAGIDDIFSEGQMGSLASMCEKRVRRCHELRKVKEKSPTPGPHKIYFDESIF